MRTENQQIQELARTVRILSAEAVEKAKSGHPGLPMGAADFSSLLWAEFLRFDPEKPDWPNRDRFVLSAGHGSMLLYSLLHLFQYNLPLSEIMNFRQWESKTPGHPEFGVTPGVETTTGPLGQGFGNGVGLGLSGKLLAQEYGEEHFNHRVFVLVSDGDMMEGIASEAASLAGHLGLNNLVYIYDDNNISLAGKTSVCFTESVPKRFEAYGWFVQSADGHNIDQMRECLTKACQENERPSLICARTIIGFGSPKKANDFEVHGAPLGGEELIATKKNLNWPLDKEFYIPEDVKSFCQSLVKKKCAERQEWDKKFDSYIRGNPDKKAKWDAQTKRTIPGALKPELLSTFAEAKKDATRNLSGKAIQVIAKHLPNFVGGSADLEPSTKTLIKNSTEIQKGQFEGRNIRFGVREHAMGAMVNGLAYSQLWFPYSATFMVFSDYMRPTIRLAALSHIQSLFIFTHESFWVGEDGPTHEPIEQIASLRLIPNLHVYRPADGMEVAMCYLSALERKNAPSVLLFTRQDVLPIQRSAQFNPDQILQGAYVVSGEEHTDFVICATGSEVQTALGAADLLKAQGKSLRVVSMPCVEQFLALPEATRNKIIPPKSRRISLEAGVTTGWEKIVGDSGLKLGIDHFGASAPGAVLAEKFGFTSQAVAKNISDWI